MDKSSSKFVNTDIDDPKYRIKPYQQMIASCTGALFTSVIGNFLLNDYYAYRNLI